MDDTKMAALQAVVSEVDAQGGPTPEQAEAAQAADAIEVEAREWGSIAYMIGGALSLLVPELRKVYTEDACLAWGQSVVPVSQKYGWGGPGSIPEIGLAISTLGLAVPSYMLVRARLKALDQKREADKQAAPAGPLDDVVAKVVLDHGG